MFDILSVRTWLIDPEFFTKYEKIILARLEAGKDLDGLIKKEPRMEIVGGEYDEDLDASIYETDKGKRVAIISLSGVMTKTGGLCSYGTRDIANQIKAINKRDDIDSVVMRTRTPGGAADSAEVLANAIRNSTKPVVAWVDGMVCSAGMWAVAPADFIMVDSAKMSSVGSIGTYAVHVDQSAAYLQKGVKVSIIRAPQSTDKVKVNDVEPLTPELISQVQEDLKNITDYFIEQVKEGRGAMLNTGDENIFTGKVYTGQRAKEMGLIDDIGSLEDAIEKAAALAETNTAIDFSQINNNADMKILSILGLANEVESKLTEEQKASLMAADAKLAEMETAHQAALTALNDQVASLTAKAGEKDAEIARLQTELDKKPAASVTKVVTDGDTGHEYNAQEDENQKVIDDLPHNKALDNNPMFNMKISKK